MEFKFIIGVDISKQWFNFCLMSAQMDILWEGQVNNDPDSIFDFITELQNRPEQFRLKDIVIVMEYTGIYVQHLIKCWLSKGARLCIVPATKVSDKLGGNLGWSEKTDTLDARRLGEYGVRFTDQLKIWKAKDQTLEHLQSMHRQRKRLYDALKMLQVPAKESSRFDSAYISEQLRCNQMATIEALKSDLKKIEQYLESLINNDPLLKELFKLITSVSGIGPVTAREIIITTEAFEKFKPDQAKSFARYAGVVPLKKQSGKMKKRDRTNKRSNRKVKTVLTMGATSLIGTKTELGDYYNRKIQEGKPHFSVINAMRNKLVLRIFAVVRNQVMYEKNLNIA